MKQHPKLIRVLVLLFSFSPLVYLFFAWNRIPQVIKIRFNIGEAIIKEQDKQVLLWQAILLSVFAAGLFFLLNNLRKVDPKVKNTTPVSGFSRIGFLVAIILVFINYFFIFTAVYSLEISEKVYFLFGGIVFALLGNYIINIKPNFFVGLRLPWTLNDANNWRETHQLAGKLWFAGGLFIALLSLLLPLTVLRPVFITIMILLVVIPSIYSYQFYKRSR